MATRLSDAVALKCDAMRRDVISNTHHTLQMDWNVQLLLYGLGRCLERGLKSCLLMSVMNAEAPRMQARKPIWDVI